MIGKLRSMNRRRAVTAVQVVVTLPVLVGAAGMAVDVGVMSNARGDMQRAVDAASLAAVTELAYPSGDGDPIAQASLRAVEFVERNAVLGRTLTIVPEKAVVFGRANYDEDANTYDFIPGETPTNAVKVTLQHSADSPNGELPLYFAGILGADVATVSASAIAIYVETHTEEADCWDTIPPGETLICRIGDSDDSDDSASGDSDDSDDSDPGDSDGSTNGDSDDSDDSEAGDSDDSDDSADSDSGASHYGDSDGWDSSSPDSDSPHTFLIDAAALPFLLEKGATSGPCFCLPGDSDDSDDSAAGDSGDSDDSHEGGHSNGGDDSESDSGSDSGSDSESDSGSSTTLDGPTRITLCHIPAGNPDNPQTITVDASAAAEHFEHGDLLNMCERDRGVHIFLIK